MKSFITSSIIRHACRVIRRRLMAWMGHATRLEEMKDTYRVLVENLKEEKAFGKHRRRWEATVKIENGSCEKK
jgi:hypothetical protein